jgi:hypothetical protein
MVVSGSNMSGKSTYIRDATHSFPGFLIVPSNKKPGYGVPAANVPLTVVRTADHCTLSR